MSEKPKPTVVNWQTLLNQPGMSTEIVATFAAGIVAVRKIKAVVWAISALSTFLTLVIFPLVLYFANDADPRILWLLLPGTLLSIGFASSAPKDVE